MREHMRATLLLMVAGWMLAAGPVLAAAPDEDSTIDVTGGSAPPVASVPPVAAPPARALAPPRVVHRLPPPDENAAPQDLLAQARDAAGKGSDWAAAEWLERAETRLLARAANPRLAGQPDASPVIEDIDAARAALSGHDRQSAVVHIDAALGRLAPPASESASVGEPPQGYAPSPIYAPPPMYAPPPVPAPSSAAVSSSLGYPASLPPPVARAPAMAAPVPVMPEPGRPGAQLPGTAAGIQGQWQWNGAGYVFVPPAAQVTAQSQPALPLPRPPVRTTQGDWQWRDGAWVWAPNGG